MKVQTIAFFLVYSTFVFSQKEEHPSFDRKKGFDFQFENNISHEFPVAMAYTSYDQELIFSVRPNRFIGRAREINNVRVTSVTGIPKGLNAEFGILKHSNSDFEIKFDLKGRLNHEINRKISVGLEYNYTVDGEIFVEEKGVESFIFKTKVPHQLEKTRQEEQKIQNLMAYPNPMVSNTTITLESLVSEDVNFQIINILGKEVYSKRIKIVAGKNYINFKRNQLPKGVYIYRVRVGREIVSKRLIIQ